MQTPTIDLNGKFLMKKLKSHRNTVDGFPNGSPRPPETSSNGSIVLSSNSTIGGLGSMLAPPCLAFHLA
jgi:hypothetical protein